MERIYLDYTATRPLDPDVLDAMLPYLKGYGANPNSLHSAGREAAGVLEDARIRVAECLGAAEPQEIVFTSCGTESDNAAIAGMAQAAADSTRRRIVVSAIEHHAVLETAKRMRSLGFEMTIVEPGKDGIVHVEDFEKALSDDVVVASVMAVNNETGAIQPVRELARVAHEHGALFHCDAVQALGKLPIDLEGSGVDAAAYSLHKIGGPKGLGILYLRRGVPFRCQLSGGGQESGRRSGTQYVAGAVACAFACEKAAAMREASYSYVTGLREKLEKRLRAIPNLHLTVDRESLPDSYVPHICSVLVEGVESEMLVLKLDEGGFEVSAGSACSSGAPEASHVLKAMRIPDRLAFGALRISLCDLTTEEEIASFGDALEEVCHDA